MAPLMRANQAALDQGTDLEPVSANETMSKEWTFPFVYELWKHSLCFWHEGFCETQCSSWL